MTNREPRRLVWFPVLGLLVGCAYALWATVVNRLSHGAAFVRLGVTWGQLTSLYLLAAPLGGLLVGLAWPLRRSVIGGFVLGALGILPMYVGAAILEVPTAPWSERLLFTLIASMVIGGSVGVGAWLDDHPRGEAPRWVDALRFPTWATVGRMWFVAAGVAALAWYVGLHWAGRWQAVAALPFFLGSLGAALGITVVAFRGQSSRSS